MQPDIQPTQQLLDLTVCEHTPILGLWQAEQALEHHTPADSTYRHRQVGALDLRNRRRQHLVLVRSLCTDSRTAQHSVSNTLHQLNFAKAPSSSKLQHVHKLAA